MQNVTNKDILQVRGETILKYCYIAIFTTAIQYNMAIENIDILHIAIYCNILLYIVLFVAD